MLKVSLSNSHTAFIHVQSYFNKCTHYNLDSILMKNVPIGVLQLFLFIFVTLLVLRQTGRFCGLVICQENSPVNTWERFHV